MFPSLNRELDLYLACYVLEVREAAALYPGPLPVDLFHDVHSMKVAYQGVCHDLLGEYPRLLALQGALRAFPAALRGALGSRRLTDTVQPLSTW